MEKYLKVQPRITTRNLLEEKTASGERLNNVDFTCAHKYLPFGTMIEVENPVTHRWVVVRVNDRGPFSKGRVVDLSYSAAKEIGMIQKGIIRVNCKVVGKNGEILLAREGATEENFREIFQQNEADSVKIPMLPESAKKKNLNAKIRFIKNKRIR